MRKRDALKLYNEDQFQIKETKEYGQVIGEPVEIDGIVYVKGFVLNGGRYVELTHWNII